MHDPISGIDWIHHDGVCLRMLNDLVRNRFYDNILRSVNGRDCIDIGFGTGLLSLIALKHGARYITAFESDRKRYSLGQDIIDKLQLQNRIKLHHGRYKHDSVSGSSSMLQFTETVDSNIWGEGIWHSLPRTGGQEFLPGRYGVEWFVTAIAPSVALTLLAKPTTAMHFDPGIELDQKFVDHINSYLTRSFLQTSSRPHHRTIDPGLHIVNYKQQTVWGELPHMKLFSDNANPSAWYCIDANDQTLTDASGRHLLDFDRPRYSTVLDLPDVFDKLALVYPRCFIATKTHKLYLDQSNSWDICRKSCIVAHTAQRVNITHEFLSGRIKYELV